MAGSLLDGLVDDGLQDGFLFTLPADAAERLVGEGIRISVPAGSVVYRDEEAPRVIVVVSGLLRVFLSSEDGRQVTVRYARSGDIAGLPLVVGGPAPMSIQAMTGSSILALRVDALRSMLGSDPAVATACAEELTRQLYRALDEISEHTFLSVRQRVARHLLDLVEVGAGPPLVVELSQQELADEIGTVREVVTRTLRQLREEGMIETSREGVQLLDPVRLSEEAMLEERRPIDQSAEAATPSPSPSQRSRGASRHRRSRS
ncbi:MAG TPA: Crp/Fnr family transcriptional regulator [Actinomycetota bacterium]|nr:Crp/Fnr family transcriptional regulator [Actinomycetota bacterium]